MNILKGVNNVLSGFFFVILLCGFSFIYIIIQPFKTPIDKPIINNSPSTTPSNNLFDSVPIGDKLVYFFWAIVIWTFFIYSYVSGGTSNNATSIL